MIRINWTRDYKGEFVCPYCLEPGLKIQGWTKRKTKTKKLFMCQKCGKYTSDSYDIKLCKSGEKINWKQDYKIGEFACPRCGDRNMHIRGFDNGKQQFYCRSCQTITGSSINLCDSVINRITHCKPRVKHFLFDDYEWDLRALIPSVNERYNGFYINFNKFPNWFGDFAKKYIYHLCKTGNSLGTIQRHFYHLKFFCCYLSEQNIRNIQEINRDTIFDYLTWDRRANTSKRLLLGVWQNFFSIGTLQGWFEIDYDIIRHDDYPKKEVKNPDPISDKVRQQIENKLCFLPDPIARMWLIAFFTAMRPGELALLKKDCLVQEGSNWKIVWNRPKGKDQHEVPITRIIAKVVQSQQEYIQQIWGDDWKYLFCHYQGLSEADPSQAGIEPVKKVIPPSRSPLNVAICCLIKAFDIRDENGRTAKFSLRLVRPTRLTQLFNQGHDLAVVSAWAGHKSSRTTVLHYTEVSCDLP